MKVLDFGLAKAIDPAESSAAAMANSPTLTARATQLGMIIGTAAYMAPEQARGRAVDRRADIWAFGVVVYEMLSGRRAFDGDDISITLASVLKEDVRWDALPADLPAPLLRLLRRCLEKDPKRRLSWIGEARLILEDPAVPQSRYCDRRRPSRPRHGSRFGVERCPGRSPRLDSARRWSRSPCGRRGVRRLCRRRANCSSASASTLRWGQFSARRRSCRLTGRRWQLSRKLLAAKSQLFVRKLDQLQAAPLAGTEGASSPFFSPDGQWIAFFAGGKLKKVLITGGAPVTLCDAEAGRGGTWTDDDSIIFTPSGLQSVKLLRVSASGGTPAVLGTLDEGAVTQRWPQALPGGKAVLYTEHSSTNVFDGANLVVAPLAGGTPKIVMRGAYYGRYVPSGLATPKRSEGGHLLYMQQGTLFAVPFNLDRLETAGQAVPAIDGLAANPAVGSASVAFSSDGTLVYVPGSAQSNTNSIEWMTRDGKTSPLRAVKAGWANPRFSPDGQKLAMDITDGKQRDIWVYDWARDRLTQLTFDAGNDRFPVWTPDGKRIVFGSDRATQGVINLYWVNADGAGEPRRLTDSPNQQQPVSWHPNGRFLAFHENRGGSTGIDLMMLPMEGDAVRGWTPGTPTAFLATPAIEVLPSFSPDGRWLAYQSNEGGLFEIYVRAFPGPGGKWRVSSDGGVWPIWSPAGRELLFLNPSSPKSWSRRTRWRATPSRPTSRSSGRRSAIRAWAAPGSARMPFIRTASVWRSPPRSRPRRAGSRTKSCLSRTSSTT